MQSREQPLIVRAPNERQQYSIENHSNTVEEQTEQIFRHGYAPRLPFLIERKLVKTWISVTGDSHECNAVRAFQPIRKHSDAMFGSCAFN